MRLLQSVLLFVLSVGISATTFAAGNWYAGIGFGYAKIDSGVSNLSAGFIRLDEDDSSASLVFGYRYSPSLSVEGHIADLGMFTVSATTAGETFTYKGSTFVSGTGGSDATGETTSLGYRQCITFVMTRWYHL